MAICNTVLDPILGCNADGGVSVANLMARLFQAIVMLGGLALLLFIAWGGFSWITAGGDKAKVEDARNKITNAIVGMAVLMATIAIVLFLQFVFGFNLLNPSLDASSSSGGSGSTYGGGSTLTCNNSSAIHCVGKPEGAPCGDDLSKGKTCHALKDAKGTAKTFSCSCQ